MANSRPHKITPRPSDIKLGYQTLLRPREEGREEKPEHSIQTAGPWRASGGPFAGFHEAHSRPRSFCCTQPFSSQDCRLLSQYSQSSPFLPASPQLSHLSFIPHKKWSPVNTEKSMVNVSFSSSSSTPRWIDLKFLKPAGWLHHCSSSYFIRTEAIAPKLRYMCQCTGLLCWAETILFCVYLVFLHLSIRLTIKWYYNFSEKKMKENLSMWSNTPYCAW